ncbi:YceI family protein [Streptosporangium saharense]|uniref:Polyisoprenoid-binding protein YceI n=1 Tax=Streptosporangium saharense TaxID=1706840 RepID=A0A7W7QUU9_9ACTN|nr:YceI family protein [Streptosporangium saharense]MBB4920162.1 polyisoprenoid-binding protein YceI [Streptosporangium saharense]
MDTYPLGPDNGPLLVRTTRTGLGARAGHDLTIEVTRWHGEAVVDPEDPARSSVSVEVDATSFAVREGTGGVKPLSDADRRDIVRNIGEKVLDTARHPVIAFRSSLVEGTAEAFRVEGDLTLAGVTRPVTIDALLADGRVRGSVTITQSRWGVKPYSALFGALRLSDEVGVWFDLALSPGA